MPETSSISIIVSSCLVKIPPSNHHQSTLTTSKLDLTPWDLQMLLLDPIQKGLLFQSDAASLVDRLRHSLSQTLSFFPPLAGRLSVTTNHNSGREDYGTVSYSVECNNEGAEFLHATAKNVSVSDILEPNYIPRETVSSFFPLKDSYRNCDGVSRPLLGVQVTELKDGVFIACTANHAVVDGTSFWHFFNSWAEMSRGCDDDKPVMVKVLPVFDRWFPSNMPENKIIPLSKLLGQSAVSEQPTVSPHLLEKVFHFSKESLTKLKAKANAEAGTDKISTLQSLSAHLWRSVERRRRMNDDVSNFNNNEPISLMVLVSARPRIPLPDGYFGNTIRAAMVSITGHELLHNDLGHVALKINDFVSGQTREATVAFVEDWVNNPVLFRKSNKQFVIISSSPRHNVYGCDFGWGKPLAVRSGKGQKSDGKMTVFPSVTEGGIDVEVCLEEKTLKSLENDDEFLEALCA